MRLEELFENANYSSWKKDNLEGFTEHLFSTMSIKPDLNSDGEWPATPSSIAWYNANWVGINSMKGCPKIIGGKFSVAHNDLSSFEFAPEIVKGDVTLSGNSFTNFHNIHKYFKEIDGKLKADQMNISGPILGLLKIRKLKSIDLSTDMGLAKIINKYLPEGDLLACQQELIDMGYEEFAKI